MKPVIIYTLPRTKGNATLRACKRTNRYNEPFGWYNVFTEFSPIERPMTTKTLFNIKQRTSEFTGWYDIQKKLDDPDTASKIFGGNLRDLPQSMSWFREADSRQTHEVFVLLRSPRELVLSLMFAFNFGFFKTDETEDREIEIDAGSILWTDNVFHEFLTYYPKNARVITFDSLPAEYFEYSRIDMEPQNALTKRLHCVKNIDEVNRNIDTILKFHQLEWEEKTGTDIFY